ncbi:hypothetical protein QYE76_037485 [Lolium multiflorum]|uniref:Uncharacterized protein n=1 Tax=Lolium multiflorum TaxID=4521 RepID=A0AAD8UV62_LOLMU|nr:hypothetical protein QYE76_037485 [Lolium multiflorum]
MVPHRCLSTTTYTTGFSSTLPPPPREEAAPMEEEEAEAEETEVEDDDDDEFEWSDDDGPHPDETADQQRALVESFESEKKLQDDARAREEAQIRRAVELSLQAAQQGTAEDARRERHRLATADARRGGARRRSCGVGEATTGRGRRTHRRASTMVVHMREGQVVRYKVNAKADMVRNNMTLIRCPCRKCGLRQWIDPDSGQLEEHLLRRGFMLGFNEEPAANVGHEEEADIGREDEESPEHGVHHEEGEADEGDDDAGGDGGGDAESKQTPLTSALRDPHVQELLLKDTGNAKPEAKLAQMEVDGMTPLYPGCRPEDTRLSVTLECLEMKAEHKWTDSSFSDNMKSWHARLPKDNTLPTSIDEAKKVVCPLDLPHVKYHACINDCALFRNEYKDRTTCPVCGQGRYKRGNKKVPLKVVWYFPITPRLQRYFVDPKEAKLMQWHAEREKPADDPEKGKILTHPADASQWNALDIEFADEFGSEPRNIRLGMSTDGLNPFGNQSSTHSTWPVFVWPYNLPPGCAQSSVQDYPGYAYVSCQVNHGFKACVKCMDKTPHLQLPKAPGSCKTVFQGTRMWLRFDHPWRKRKDLFNGEEELGRAPRPRSGEEISELLENWEECPAPGKKRPRESPLLGVWKARSVFWDLPYWKVLHTPHSLDVMHITKNVTESLLGTLMNMPERTKDGPKARTDLKLLGLKKELQYPTDSDDDDDEQTETTQGHHKRAVQTKRTPDDAEELLAKIGRNHDDWSTPEPTPTPIVKKRGMIKLNDEDMREAKKSLKEKGIKPEDVKNLPPIEDICETIPPSSMIEYMKDIVTNKRKIPNEEISTMLANYSFNGKIPKKLGDPGVSVMPFSLYKRLDLDKLIPTDISLQMADKSTAIPVGLCENVPVQVTQHCLILTDFVVLEMPEDDNMSIILGRPFLNTGGCY